MVVHRYLFGSVGFTHCHLSLLKELIFQNLFFKIIWRVKIHFCCVASQIADFKRISLNFNIVVVFMIQQLLQKSPATIAAGIARQQPVSNSFQWIL